MFLGPVANRILAAFLRFPGDAIQARGRAPFWILVVDLDRPVPVRTLATGTANARHGEPLSRSLRGKCRRLCRASRGEVVSRSIRDTASPSQEARPRWAARACRPRTLASQERRSRASHRPRPWPMLG